ncbi:MAG: DUF4105 domain-containing protein [Flavobacteriaceae bacterium]|nr:DUF4105 domain-containing protein [Flavobacteriaceae bacterium]
MKKSLLFLVFIVTSLFSFSQNYSLSPQAEISVITCGPGPDLYSAFGHSAFRVTDPARRIDIIYNYGTFNFNTPNFYTKFAQGKLLYQLSKDSYFSFIQLYINEGRWVKEQVLDLDEAQKIELLNFLEHNAKPENRHYKYDFFFDNCATKIRDVVNIAFPDQIVFTEEHVDEECSFRELIHKNINQNSWGSFGIDLSLGSEIDRTASPDEVMYLPEYIYKAFSYATFKSGKKLVKSELTLLEEKITQEYSTPFLYSPLFVFGVLAFIILLVTYFDNKEKKKSLVLDFSIFLITGLIGVFLLLLWFATDHTATVKNFNLLWAFMPNLLLSFLVLKKKPVLWLKNYLTVLLLMLGLIVIFWLIGLQSYPIAIIPLLIALAVRYLYLRKLA